MTLLELPAELRLQIFDHIPDLIPGRHETVGPNVRLTPAISRVNHLTRVETLPLYARSSSFVISLQPDDSLSLSSNNNRSGSGSGSSSTSRNKSRIAAWLAALGPTWLPYVRNLQLSRDWLLPRPSRWEGHIGFYVRLQRGERGPWRVEAGTYPIANDVRGLRAESVELLRSLVLRRMMVKSSRGSRDEESPRREEARGLCREDVEFLARAMGIVASHPIPAFDMEQSEVGKKQRREVWMEMERLLGALDGSDEATASPDEHRRLSPGGAFYTPY